MRKFILMTSAVVIFPLSSIAQTTCTASPSCTTLGYTESSCPDGNGVKCPWGNKWFCGKSCDEIGFLYSCNGTGHSGGIGDSCEGKYKSCNCANGYIWRNEKCVEDKAVWKQCSGYAVKCALGDILYSDGTCNANMISGKTPIAVVVYKSNDCGQAIALNSIGEYFWQDLKLQDIPALMSYASEVDASQDFASCENTAKIIAAGSKISYPAAWAAHEYSTEGTSAGDWCLPAAGILTSIYNNKTKVNAGLIKGGGTQFTDESYTGIWSSCEAEGSLAWKSDFDNTYGDNKYGISTIVKNHEYIEVDLRPVIEF